MQLAVFDFGGDGRDVLLLHGGGDNIETWRAFAPLLRSRFRLVAYDARGHGQSPTPGEASVADMVADISAVVETLRLDRPLLVGHSMGGVNALLAAGGTDSFAGVVALDAVPRWWSRPDLSQAELEEIGRSRGLGWTGTAEDLEEEAARLAESSDHAELIRAVFRRNHELDGGGRWRRKPLPDYALRLAQIYQGPESGLTRERIEAGRCPVVMLCSEAWVTGTEARRTLADLPTSIEVVWLDSGHYLHWDQPDEVAGRIEAFA